MAEEATPVTEPETAPVDETVPAERFREVAKHKKAAEDRAKALEREVADIRAAMEERDSQGLPELERLRKSLEQTQKRADEAEKRATDQERAASNLRKESWVTAAARDLGFIDPEDALNPRYVDLDGIESKDDAERVLKRVAKQKAHLVKPAEPDRPQIGKVLENGQAAKPGADPVSGDLNDPGFRRQLGEDMLAVLRGGKS
jgi:hypothetical protein